MVGSPMQSISRDKTIIYEEAAEKVAIVGWKCKICSRFYGEHEHSARWCCATDLPCKSCETGRIQKHRVRCHSCQANADLERWLKLPEKEWDGEAVLAIWHDDTYFFDAEEILDHLSDYEGDAAIEIEEMRLVICERIYPPTFNLAEHCQDYLPDEVASDFYTAEIDEAVNKFILENFPPVYEPMNVRASLESLKKHLELADAR